MKLLEWAWRDKRGSAISHNSSHSQQTPPSCFKFTPITARLDHPATASHFTRNICRSLSTGVTACEWAPDTSSGLLWQIFDCRCVCLCNCGSLTLPALLDRLCQTKTVTKKGTFLKRASPSSHRNEFRWNSLSHWRLWEVPEDLVCVDLCASDLSGVPHAGLCVHRRRSPTFVPLCVALRRRSGLVEL